jgi:hypothetical protein
MRNRLVYGRDLIFHIKTCCEDILKVCEKNAVLNAGKHNNEKDSPTIDLTVRPLSGAITASPLLNSDGGAKVKNIRKFRGFHSF